MKHPSSPALHQKNPLWPSWLPCGLLAFAIPFLAISAVLLLGDMYPFGVQSSAMGGDSVYLSYVAGLKRLLNGESFYQLTSLFTESAHLHARYMGSPLTWLHAALPLSCHEAAFWVLLAVRAGLMGLAMSLLLQFKRFSLSPTVAALLAGCFGITAIASAKDGLALLPEQMLCIPLLLRAFLSLVEDKRLLPLLLSLAFALLTGYAFFFAALIFALLFALLLMADASDLRAAYRANAAALTWRMGVALLAALLLAAPVWLSAPAGIGEDLTSAAHGSGWLSARLSLLLLSFLPGVQADGIPILYAGMPLLLCLPLIFANRQRPLRYRLTVGGLTGLLLFVFLFFNPLSGALSPVLIFLMLVAVADLLSRPAPHLRVVLACTAGVLLLAIMAAQLIYKQVLFNGKVQPLLHHLGGVYAPLLVLALTVPLLSKLLEGQGDKKGSKGVSWLLLAILVFDTGFAAYGQLAGTRAVTDPIKVVPIVAADTPADRLLAKQEDQAPYRIAFFGSDTLAVGTGRHRWLQKELPSSALSPHTAALLTALGYQRGEQYSHRPYLVSDALMGVGYTLSAGVPYPGDYRYTPRNASDTFTPEGYTLVASRDELSVYKSPALPLVFVASSAVKSLPATAEGMGVTDFANRMFTAFLGAETKIYQPVPYQITGTDKLFATDTGYAVEQHAEGGTLSLQLNAPLNGPLYYIPQEQSGVDYLLRPAGKKGSTHIPAQAMKADGMLFLGNFNSQGTYKDTDLYKNLYTSSLLRLQGDFFYVADTEQLAAACDTLKNTAADISLPDNTMKGTVTLEEGQVLMTLLPYDGDYEVLLDGESAQAFSVCGLLAVTAEAGVHTLHITRAADFQLGLLPLLLFCAGLVLTLLAAAYHRRIFRDCPTSKK